MKYTGGCHCGAVRYGAEADLSQTIICNCSHCSKKGFILAFIPGERFTLLSGEDMLTEYRFGEKSLAYLFCKTCGTDSFARGTEQDGQPIVALNVRCLDGVDLSVLHPTKYDGLSR